MTVLALPRWCTRKRVMHHLGMIAKGVLTFIAATSLASFPFGDIEVIKKPPQKPVRFEDIFKGRGVEAHLSVPSNYASNVVNMPPGTQETDILTLTLDPSVSPVWTIVVLSRPAGFGGTGALDFSLPSLGLGRLYISGGGGGGISGIPIPFDPQSMTILTVPASTIRITIDTRPVRIPGSLTQGAGNYSAYAVPDPIGKGEGAIYTEWTDDVAAGAEGDPGISGVVATLVDAVTVLPSETAGTGVTVANLGSYRVNIGFNLFSRAVWSFPSANSNTLPLWMPVPASAEGTLTVTNTSGAPARYTVINRLRI